MGVRKTLIGAVAAAKPTEPHRIGRDLLWRGTVTMTLWDADGRRIRIGIDYGKTGSRAGMPGKVPLERCERVEGINNYEPSELVSRKLQTIIGDKPRQKARDIYDAAWILTEHPELLVETDKTRLCDWRTQLTPEMREELQDRRDHHAGRERQ